MLAEQDFNGWRHNSAHNVLTVFIRFLSVMTHYYDGWLVALSIAIAVVASFITLELAQRVRQSNGRAVRWWIICGALSMGIGIWAMHFIGMLAFHLPIVLDYDFSITLASVVPAILASGLALVVIRRQLSLMNYFLSALLMGGGIAAMHYTGMAAMKMQPSIRYDPALFSLSILIAVAASFVALKIAARTAPSLLEKMVSSAVMGAAIAGMHYTGMAAATFDPGSICTARNGMDASLLVATVASGAFLVLLVTAVISVFDARMANQSAKMVDELRKLNAELHQRAAALAETMTEEISKNASKNQLLATVLDNVLDGIITINESGIVQSFNKAAEQIFFYNAVEVIGQNIKMLMPEPYRGKHDDYLHNYITTGDKKIIGIGREVVGKRKDGSIIPIDLAVSEIRGGTRMFTGIVRDISERKAIEERMQHLAHHDQLTGLPNRTLFTDRLHQALAKAKRGSTKIALMFIDLDKFKHINDTLGHDVGDLLLKEVAKHLQDCLRESDTAARIGGDEFVVLLPSIEAEQDGMLVAEKIRHVLSQPFELAGHSLHITSSIGVAVYPDHGDEEELLLKNADTAMYYAKKSGRNNVKCYQPDMYESES